MLILHPAHSSIEVNDSIAFTQAFFRIISPPVDAVAERYVAPAILSGIMLYSQPLSFFTPFITILLSPSPFIFAPHFLRYSARSHISGSLAELFITVSPSARTAHRIIFSVAPTEGNESDILAP